MRTDLTEEISASSESRRGRKLTYVLITPARNEAAFIELTITSMISQTVTPLKWMIVSDGSTDGTDDIVRRYASEYEWIELMRMPERRERNFAGKAHAFNAGYAKVKGLQYDIIGNIDADISFRQDHFEFLIDKFVEDTSLGVAGTAFIEGVSVAYNYDFVNIEHVSGQCQLFRRACFEEIGGYLPIKGGGVDWTAVTTARMKGWKTRTFTEKPSTHHRKMGTAMSTSLASRFRVGRQDYYLGGHPLWEIFRSIYQMTKKPYILGGMLLIFGFYWSMLMRVEKSVTKELEVFRRREQMHRLRDFLKKCFY